MYRLIWLYDKWCYYNQDKYRTPGSSRFQMWDQALSGPSLAESRDTYHAPHKQGQVIYKEGLYRRDGHDRRAYRARFSTLSRLTGSDGRIDGRQRQAYRYFPKVLQGTLSPNVQCHVQGDCHPL